LQKNVLLKQLMPRIQADEVVNSVNKRKICSLTQSFDQEIAEQTERYQVNPEQPSIDYAQVKTWHYDEQILSELESVRVR
jgi:hypothetical protein